MIKFYDYIKYLLILHNISFNDIDKNVLEYTFIFDDINEEPLYKNGDLVLYISKHNGCYTIYYEIDSKPIGKKININDAKNINIIFNKFKENI